MAGISAAIKSLAAFSLVVPVVVVPVVVRLGAPFKDVQRDILFANLRGQLGGVASWASTHGMNLPSNKDEVAADFALAGILACTRMRREWLLPMLETGALGVPGSFDSKKGGEGKRGKGKTPSRKRNDVDGKAQELSGLDQKGYRALLPEQRVFWRDEARKAAAADDEGSDEGPDEGSDEGESEG